MRKCRKGQYSCLFVFLLTLVIFIEEAPIDIYADSPYETYSYDWWGDDIKQPAAYTYSGSYTIQNSQDSYNIKDTEQSSEDSYNAKDTEQNSEDSMNQSNIPQNNLSFNAPKDMVIANGKIYIADTGNSRIVILNEDGSFIQSIDSFINEGIEDTFSGPQGIFVTKEGSLYIADTKNGRIVELDESGEFVREIKRPQTDLISENQAYASMKLVVDKSGRIYTIASGINMGLVEFDKNGEFQGFMGAAKVSVSTFEYIWKNYFSTDAQKERMELIIPTEYSNLFLDSDNFIYATISNLSEDDFLSGADAIRRLNPTGTDILRRLGNTAIIGDLYNASDTANWSKFTDVCALDYGVYFILDSAGGKVFAYDADGNSLFIFGGIGNRQGMLMQPAAIGISEGEETIYILDSQLNSILTFTITEYGRHLLNAIEKNSAGDSKGAYEEWQEVLRYNANSEFAYIGIGKAYLRESRYKEAMEYFKLGNNRKYYTRAFQFYRKELMQQYFGGFMAVILVLVGIFLIYKIVKKIKRWVGEAKCSI